MERQSEQNVWWHSRNLALWVLLSYGSSHMLQASSSCGTVMVAGLPLALDFEGMAGKHLDCDSFSTLSKSGLCMGRLELGDAMSQLWMMALKKEVTETYLPFGKWRSFGKYGSKYIIMIIEKSFWWNEANLRDLVAATGLVFLLKIGFNTLIFGPMWPGNLVEDLKKQ